MLTSKHSRMIIYLHQYEQLPLTLSIFIKYYFFSIGSIQNLTLDNKKRVKCFVNNTKRNHFLLLHFVFQSEIFLRSCKFATSFNIRAFKRYYEIVHFQKTLKDKNQT